MTEPAPSPYEAHVKAYNAKRQGVAVTGSQETVAR